MSILLSPVPPRAAAAQLVSIAAPVSGNGVPQSFCATGTADGSVTTVTVELWNDTPTLVASYSAAVSGGYWSCQVTLPSTSTSVIYELRAYNAVPGDGSSCIRLQYDPNLADETCAVTRQCEDEKVDGYVGPMTVNYPEPKIAMDTTYETVLAEKVMPTGKRMRFAPVFTTNPPRSRTAYLPDLGKGLYVVQFIHIDGMGTVKSYSKKIFSE